MFSINTRRSLIGFIVITVVGIGLFFLSEFFSPSPGGSGAAAMGFGAVAAIPLLGFILLLLIIDSIVRKFISEERLAKLDTEETGVKRFFSLKRVFIALAVIFMIGLVQVAFYFVLNFFK